MNDLKKLEKAVEEMRDEYRHLLIVARDSAPPSISGLLSSVESRVGQLSDALENHIVTEGERDEEVKTDIKEILSQVKTTNGRVSSLENYKYFLMGGLAILTVLVIPVLFRLIK